MICLCKSVSAQAPQVLRVSQIKEDSWVSESLQHNGDHFYVKVENRNDQTKDITDDLVIDSLPFVEEIVVADGQPLSKNGMLILDYEVGNGFVDYDFISHVVRHDGFYKNDSLVAISVTSTNCTWNGKTYSPELIPDSVLIAELDNYIAVIDHVNDTLKFITKTPWEFRLRVDMLTLDGDYLYVVTRTNEDTFEFMGEFFPEVIDPNWNVKHIHKINWKTGIKEWSRQFSTDIDQDYLFDIKVVDDGNLIIAKRITGRTHWDGVPIEGNTVYDSGYAFFKISPAGELVDYIQSECDCKGFDKIHIEEDGALMLYGAQQHVPNLTLGTDTFEMHSDTALFGIFGYVSADWSNQWIKSYLGSYTTVVGGGGYSQDKNEIRAFIFYKEDTNVEGFQFETEDKGYYENPNDGRSETILVSYNKDGTLSHEPVTIPLDARIYEIHEVNENHYLFYIEEEFGATSYLFGTRLDDFNKANFMIFEIEGELFDILDNLDELTSPYINKLEAYPNPVASEGTLTAFINQDLKNVDKLQLVSSTGEMTSLTDYTIENGKIKINLPTLATGAYYLLLQNDSYSNNIKLIIK